MHLGQSLELYALYTNPYSRRSYATPDNFVRNSI
jgi:hypothetical protein